MNKRKVRGIIYLLPLLFFMIKKGTVVLVYHEKYGVVVGIKNDSYKIRMFGEWGSRLEHYIDHCDVWDVREI